MNCPQCDYELEYHDYYFVGRPARYYGNASNGIYYPSTNYKKRGDIFKCNNENCEMFEQFFYTDERECLHEGYPC